MRTNIKTKLENNLNSTNSVGTPVRTIGAEAQLVRSVLANMLWEDEFYEDGISNAKRIESLVSQVSPSFVGELAKRARNEFKLRHVPLLLVRELARNGKMTAAQLTDVIERPDEISEFLSIYWKDGKTAIANQVKKGLANSFHKFNEFQLSKWDKNSSAITLRDVLFLVHAKPKGREDLFKRIANQELATADTWETNLSAGADKAETFSRLMAEKKLGALAFLRNLRNMLGAGIAESTIRAYADTLNVEKVLPFRYLAAAKIVPQLEDMLEGMMFRSLESTEKLKGRTLLVVDTSGSMRQPISGKSDLSRFDAAKALTILAREICEDVVVYATAGSDMSRKHATIRVPARRGFALGEYLTSGALVNSIGGGGIFLKQCMDYIASDIGSDFDRVIVFTDEQDCSGSKSDSPEFAKLLGKNNYILNVGSYQNGVNSGKWTTITGFSEAVIDYIRAIEKL